MVSDEHDDAAGPATPAVASLRGTGAAYRVVRTQPASSALAWPVLVDQIATRHDIVSVGGGARGVNVQLAPAELIRLLSADVADVTSPAVARG